MASALCNCEFHAVHGSVETVRSDGISVLQGSQHGSARILSAIPMAKPFVVSASVLRTGLRISMGLGVVGPEHPHCGLHGGFAGDISGNAEHIKSCSVLGRGIRARGAVKNTVAHMAHHGGLSAEVAGTEKVYLCEWK